MLDSKKGKLLMGIGFLSVLISVWVFSLHQDKITCLGVSLLPEKQLEDYIYKEILNPDTLMYNDEKAVLDENSKTIYVSQDSSRLSHYSELKGALYLDSMTQAIYFIEESVTEDLEGLCREGKSLRLVVVDGTYYDEWKVVLTTLPILRMANQDTFVDETGQVINVGEFALFEGVGSAQKHFGVKVMNAQWHQRGVSIISYEKKSWKISLKDKGGNNKNYDFLGMGEDDDWILNPMVMDDTKLREKFMMDLWNTYLSSEQEENKMSTGEYIELVIDNQYQGLYLLQRRVDVKYLGLNKKSDILLKGRSTWMGESIEEKYEIVYSPYPQNQTYKIVGNYLNDIETYTQNLYHHMNMDNFINVNLFLQLCSSTDNRGTKNMFYVFRKDKDGYRISWIPWDTDMSMGVTWTDGFVYDYGKSMGYMPVREEYEALKASFPELEQKMEERWKQLRQYSYREDILGTLLQENGMILMQSGALYREQDLWGLIYHGEDMEDNLYSWLMDKISIMDNHYNR